MNDIKVMVWLYPILFMFHDFEEIIFMQSWINRNRNYLYNRFPVFTRLDPHTGFENSAEISTVRIAG